MQFVMRLALAALPCAPAVMALAGHPERQALFLDDFTNILARRAAAEPSFRNVLEDASTGRLSRRGLDSILAVAETGIQKRAADPRQKPSKDAEKAFLSMMAMSGGMGGSMGGGMGGGAQGTTTSVSQSGSGNSVDVKSAQSKRSIERRSPFAGLFGGQDSTTTIVQNGNGNSAGSKTTQTLMRRAQRKLLPRGQGLSSLFGGGQETTTNVHQSGSGNVVDTNTRQDNGASHQATNVYQKDGKGTVDVKSSGPKPPTNSVTVNGKQLSRRWAEPEAEADADADPQAEADADFDDGFDLWERDEFFEWDD